MAHNPLSLDPEGSEVSQGAFEEEDGAVLSFIRHDLSEGEAGSVVDADVDEFPAGPAHLIAPIVRNAVAGADDPAELLDVEVEQLTGVLTLVTCDWRSGLQGAQSGESVAAEQA